MKHGTLYAKRVKKVFTRLKHDLGKPDPPEPTDPIQQLLTALLSAGVADSRAARAVRSLQEAMVDINEIRVSTSGEIAAAIDAHVPNSAVQAESIRRALNAIYRKEHVVQLDHLHKMGRREARQYLESLDGVDKYAAASVMLWSLGGHAIPVDDRLFEALRKEKLVDPSATVDEVQAFLERNINANEAKVFCLLMQKFVTGGGSGEASATGKDRGRDRTMRTSRKKTSRGAPTRKKKTTGDPKTSTRSKKRTASR